MLLIDDTRNDTPARDTQRVRSCVRATLHASEHVLRWAKACDFKDEWQSGVLLWDVMLAPQAHKRGKGERWHRICSQ